MPSRVRCTLAVVVLAFAACAFAAYSAGFGVAWRPLIGQAGLLLLLALLSLRYSQPGRSRALQLALEASAWSIALSSLFSFPMYLVLRNGSGFADASLIHLDASLGLDWHQLPSWVGRHPWCAHALGLAYDSLRVAAVLALLLPALAGRVEWTSELLLALATSAVLSLLLLLRVRAIGPWVGAGFTAGEAQASCESLLRAIDRGARLEIDVSRSAPLIAFPSWHVILAVLSAQTLARFRYAPLPAISWAILVAVSTLSTGWHYGVDVLGGVLVAAVAIALSKLLLRLPSPALASALQRSHVPEK